MDRASAVNLIRSTFESAFDKDGFTKLVWNLLKNPESTDERPLSGQYIPTAFRGHIKSYTRIGKYYSPEEERIDLLIINLHKESSLIQARTLQRNFIRWYLKYGRNGAEKDAVLAAIVSPGDEDWRFSLVKMEYALEATASGSVDAREKLTPAKRYSFIVGKNERSHTAQQSLLPMLLDDQAQPTLAQLEQSFNVEKITNEFFEKYKGLFLKLREALVSALDQQPTAKSEFEIKGVNTADFAKKLLGQIVFLYFLQKKGWFGVARDAEWGTGPKDFIRSLFAKSVVDYDNFFNDILEPLFYSTLAWPRPEDFSDKFNSKIPFLNGGLFDPLNDYDWLHTDILLPNELFSNDEKTPECDVGTGILDVFDRYNFTVCEDEPLDKEVAVDPEMLGKVFENLLEVSDRKSKGAFYTPREIVHYMCQESLINHLAAELPAVDRGQIELLIRSGDTTIENDAAAAQCEEKGTTTYEYKLPPAIRENARTIDDKLADIRVCDPAVGSGAFIVGMMNEIVRARLALSRPANRNHTPYRLKRHAIQNCLYGVDIEPGAVEIAKLRLWLSLVVDEEDRASIKPLPNLDYKIMQGSSLLDEYHGVKLFDDVILAAGSNSAQAQIEALEKQRTPLQREYFDLKFASKPDKLRLAQLENDLKQIADSIKKLKTPQESSPQDGLWDGQNNARDKAEELKKLHVKFFGQSNAEEKKQIKAQIETLGWELIEASLKEQGKDDALVEVAQFRENKTKPFFLWKLNFWEVFEDKGGFDVVIGNPPYVRADGSDDHLDLRKAVLSSGRYQTLWEKWDLYVAFIELGYWLLHQDGITTMIVSDAYCHSKYAEKSQKWFLKNGRVIRLDFLGRIKVFDAAVRNVVYFFQKADGAFNKPERRVHDPEFGTVNLLPTGEQQNLTHRAFFPEDSPKRMFGCSTVLLEDICYISKGMVVHANEKKVRGAFELKDLVSNRKDEIHPKPFVEGKHLDRWLSNTREWLEWGTSRSPSLFSRPTFPELYSAPEKLLIHRTGGDKIRISYDASQTLCNHTVLVCLLWHALAEVRNNSLKKATRYPDEKPPRPDLPNRLVLEETSRRFHVKFLLAIMNSNAACGFLRSDRRSNTDLYPEDWKQLPIPDVDDERQAPIVALVDRLLAAKRNDADANLCELEEMIDQLVYELYQLTPEEVALVESEERSENTART